MLAAENISKVYRLYQRPADRLWEALPFARPRGVDFWALRDINFRVGKGETLGVIGPNGGGKSTLLQVLAGILQPTTGRVVRSGRIAALLELGAGFNLEFSGRENVFINGEIMGLPRAAIEAALPSIERFAGIGEFFDRPVKTYSSGMHVRLAFSAAIHVNPDVLIVDEALAVGDAVFANRCIRKFEELQQAGVTVVFVSHDLGLVKQICSQAIFLMEGRIQASGSPADVVNRYVGAVLEKRRAWQAEGGLDLAGKLRPSHRHGDRIGEVVDVEMLDSAGRPVRSILAGERLRVRVLSRFHAGQPEPVVGLMIRTRTGMEAYGTNTKLEGIALPGCAPGELLEVEFAFDCLLTPQEYTLTVAAQHSSGHSHDWLDDALAFRVVDPVRRAGVANLPVEVVFRKSAPEVGGATGAAPSSTKARLE